MRERVVERGVAWGIMKLRVDGGCEINVGVVLALATGVQAGARRAGMHSWRDERF